MPARERSGGPPVRRRRAFYRFARHGPAEMAETMETTRGRWEKRADACATARRLRCARAVHDDMRLKRSARMLHERGAGGGCACPHVCCRRGYTARQRRAAAIRQARRVQGSDYRAPKPSRPQPSFRDAGATVVSV
ncbi:conserved hypothetical protein [Burkholderia cenocepacia HI2424]|uniref:Uncharacterized protein n=2 Tax=Burkholderia cepacia complex TaxID=87882 RepID=A0A3R9BI97_9BURK|nr:conserved hypothetical protein [Burkholderia cenocepacia HI2424]PNO72779.1 hypothetical protein DK10_017135 [Burkholderia cenocepacia]RSC04336.1 hypothetical protein EGT41_34405 [Burkholderia cenocepacia]